MFFLYNSASRRTVLVTLWYHADHHATVTGAHFLLITNFDIEIWAYTFVAAIWRNPITEAAAYPLPMLTLIILRCAYILDTTHRFYYKLHQLPSSVDTFFYLT